MSSLFQLTLFAERCLGILKIYLLLMTSGKLKSEQDNKQIIKIKEKKKKRKLRWEDRRKEETLTTHQMCAFNPFYVPGMQDVGIEQE